MTKKIIDYLPIFERSIYPFGIIIKDLMKEGWQPLGGISYSSINEIYIQVMVKYEDKMPSRDS
jgi:hypothetical protein